MAKLYGIRIFRKRPRKRVEEQSSPIVQFIVRLDAFNITVNNRPLTRNSDIQSMRLPARVKMVNTVNVNGKIYIYVNDNGLYMVDT